MIGIETATAEQAVTAMMCVLRVADARFCIAAERICEVLGEMTSMPVPLSPRYIAGVVPYRGEVLTAVSLRVLLGIETEGGTCVLILQDDEAGERFGLIVDAVEGLMTFGDESLERNPGSLDAKSRYLFDGLYRTELALMARIDAKQLWPSRIAEAGLFEEARNEPTGWTR